MSSNPNSRRTRAEQPPPRAPAASQPLTGAKQRPLAQYALLILIPKRTRDYERLQLTFKKETTGSQVFQHVCNNLNIPTRDRQFFGLEIPQNSTVCHVKWLRDEKLVRKQVSAKNVPDGCIDSGANLPQLRFSIKVFPDACIRPESETARQYCCYVIRSLVRERKLFPSLDRLVQLCACTLQSLFGDYSQNQLPYNHPTTPDDFQEKLACFDSTELPEELIPAIKRYYANLAGMLPAAAEQLFLEYAHNIDLYGVHLYDVKDTWQRELNIGVSIKGVLLYDSKLPRNTVQLQSISENEGWSQGARPICWSHIQKLKYTDRVFSIDYYTQRVDDPNAYSIETVNFKLNHFRSCKDLYFACIKHHEIYKQTNLSLQRQRAKRQSQESGEAQEHHQRKSPYQTSPGHNNNLTLPGDTVDPQRRSNSSSGSSAGFTSQPSRGRMKAITSTIDCDPVELAPTQVQLTHIRSLRKPVKPVPSVKRKPIHTDSSSERYFLIKLYPGPVLDDQANVYGFSYLSMTTGNPVVSKIVPGSSADRSELQKGDQLIQMNNVDIRDFSYEQISRHVAASARDSNSNGCLNLVVVSGPPARSTANTSTTSFFPPKVKINSDDLDESEHMPPQTPTMEASIEQLRKDVADKTTTSQFFEVPVKRPGMTWEDADKPKNLGKNRYKDIKPYDETRVVLRPWSGVPSGDYINANIVEISLRKGCRSGMTRNSSQIFYGESGPNSTNGSLDVLGPPSAADRVPRRFKFSENWGSGYDELDTDGIVSNRQFLRYIAAQGPKHSTCADFWTMIHQYDIRFVVMLTRLEDRGREKCHEYWPRSKDEPLEMPITPDFTRKISITLLEEQHVYSPVNPNILIYSKRWFRMEITGESAVEVLQCQYYAWPDHGVPDDTSDFLDFVEFCSKIRDDMDRDRGLQTTVCVHCSAGIGRTGVYIQTETAMNQIRQNIPTSSQRTLEQMRDFRPHMVQTEKQYTFACEAILKWYDTRFMC